MYLAGIRGDGLVSLVGFPRVGPTACASEIEPFTMLHLDNTVARHGRRLRALIVKFRVIVGSHAYADFWADGSKPESVSNPS